MNKFRNVTVIHDGAYRKKKAAIYTHDGKHYVLSSIASAYRTKNIDGKEYTEVICLGLNTENEYWSVGSRIG